MKLHRFIGTRVPVAVGLLALLCACGAEFDSAGQLSGLRVLAVKKSSPYVRPGGGVKLELLWHDTEAQTRTGPPQMAWLALCENPPGDLFEQCLSQPLDLEAPNLASRVSLPPADAELANDSFSFTTSPNLISSRPPPKDPTVPAYGLNYVFFAACGGEIDLRPGLGFPFPCFEELDDQPGFTAGDRRLDSKNFVVGYSAVFGYEQLENQNPLILGWSFDGVRLMPESGPGTAETDDADVMRLAPPDFCIGSECTPPPREEDPASCPDLLTLPACSGDCRVIDTRPIIDPASAEIDAGASSGRDVALGEQMWVNYYSAGGEFEQEVRLLNDAIVGWNDDVGTGYQPDPEARVSYLWAVAHDNRGGVEWARLRICTR